MLDKLIKRKDERNPSDTSKDKSKNKGESSAKKTPVADPVSEQEWQSRMSAAATTSDDSALLVIARDALALSIKQAAVEAMSTETGLKAAEREFRSHDRRIYRLAKLRYEGTVTQRLAREEATTLIASAEALLTAESIPANRFVDIDRAWHRLDASRLAAEQIAQYQTVSQKLTETLRARGDQQLSFKRWLEDTARARQELIDGCVAVAQSGIDRDKLAAMYDRIEALRGQGAVLPNEADAARHEAQVRDVEHMQSQLEAVLALARALDARLAFLDSVLQQAASATDQTTSPSDDGSLNARWQALPVVSDARVLQTLNERFDAYRRAQLATNKAASARARSANAEQAQQAQVEEQEALRSLLDAAEASLAAGHVVEAAASLAAIDAAIKSKKGKIPLASRIERVRAEIARLRGWQHWGGGRVREDLVTEAAQLAEAIKDPKLNVRKHGEAIEQLRNRWKELDKLGGASSKELWAKFDGALKVAHLPVDAMVAKQKAQRQENLTQRNALIKKLQTATPTLLIEGNTDWRAVARELEQFTTEWRKFGPIEHTVPHKAQAALLATQKAAIDALEQPLSEARRNELQKRQQLVERAREIAAQTDARDTINRVRTLQAEWQLHAKAMPLARHDENRLWNEFKSATDAVFKARDAVTAARNAAAKTQLEASDQLIEKLTALGEDTPPAEIRRVLNEVDSAWRKRVEVPRHLAAKLESRFRAARDHARDLVAGGAKRSWATTCDALARKLALCVAVENRQAESVEEEWATLPPLPTEWETALRARRDGQPTSKNVDGALVNDALLQLEAALEIASPPAFQAARSQLKLLALKRAIERREVPVDPRAEIRRLIAVAVSRSFPDASGSTRFAAIVNALRGKPLA
jgi:exonuclease SbcC